MDTTIYKYIKSKYKHISYSNIKNIEGYYKIIKKENNNNTVDNAIILYYISSEVNDDFLDIQHINYTTNKFESKYYQYHKYSPDSGMKNEEIEMIKFRLAVNYLINKGYSVEDARNEVNTILGNLVILKSTKIQIIQKILPLIIPISKISPLIYYHTYESFVS
jgi:hypothetical protein